MDGRSSVAAHEPICRFRGRGRGAMVTIPHKLRTLRFVVVTPYHITNATSPTATCLPTLPTLPERASGPDGRVMAANYGCNVA